MKSLLIACFAGALTMAVPSFAEEQATDESPAELKTMQERFTDWSAETFTFEGTVKNARRSRPEFQLRVNEVHYSVVFDAGRAKRTAVLDCLDLADECDIRGEALMIFGKGEMKLNITDITWLSIPEIDFDEKATRLHRCMKSAQRHKTIFASVVELKLNVLDLERRQAWDAEAIEPREETRGTELVREALSECFSSRFRLPIGSYRVKVFTQSAETFLWTWEE